ncbi:Hypothetical protein FKW44_011701 [Caligus rogercresseyi]|uniref:Uncharacterized protein n=1 Tax=Caligus rogercresseyi TaxID=217165 RepID=A0A7T8K9W1_CALRO|nr:Hypothetical protein FKW44_011701 [Caligus rogercresseyi]
MQPFHRNRPIRPFHFVLAQIVPAQIVPVQIVPCPIRPCPIRPRPNSSLPNSSSLFPEKKTYPNIHS